MKRKLGFSLAMALLLIGSSSFAQQSIKPRLAFEVASIRPSGPAVLAPGARGGGGAGPGGCANGLVQVDPRRFVMNGVSLQALISFAYPEWAIPLGGCPGVSSTNLLSAGPAWVRSEQWDIQAVIPEGVSTATTSKYVNRQAPEVDQMLQALLADRFKLVLRRETKEMPVHFLTVAKGGPKFNGLRPGNGRGRSFSQDENGNVVEVRREDIRNRLAAQRSVGVQAYKLSMADWAKSLNGQDGRLVLDRTGLTGEYSFYFDNDPAGRPVLNRQEEIGLKIEDGTAAIDVWVIERAERPSEN
jgi:uncharacterized protein (TIGR03435 family)